MKLKFGRAGSSEPLPTGRLITSLEAPLTPTAPAAVPAAPAAPVEPAASEAHAAPAVSAVDLDALAARVVERLGQSPLPEPLARIVAEVSERLVREEIARIREKAGLRT